MPVHDRRAPSTATATRSTDSAQAVVVIDGVTKRFGEVDALGLLSLAVPAGRITVLLGPNGAGKTTAIRLITGALVPDEGSVSVFGIDPGGRDGEDVRMRCGVVSAKPSLYDRLSGMDNLRYAAELYGLGRGSGVDARVVEAADQFGIAADLEQRVGGYSTGMKTRLALARAVLHQPTLMLLDEPTSGLDPESAVAVLAMVRDMTAEGKTVLMCTHLLLEAERLADQIVVIDKGAHLLSGDPDTLAARFWPHPTVSITTTDGFGLDTLAGIPGVADYQRSGDTAAYRLDVAERVPHLVAALAEGGAAIESVVPFQPSLEDLYFAIRAQYGRGPNDPSDYVAWRRRAPGQKTAPEHAQQEEATR
ncbi:MAG: ABC transporter ATP-binding protein [Acidimicrobiia bacterium]|nr:ABC transporter ATP-binding protein [Acidimicrobiia bacterium]